MKMIIKCESTDATKRIVLLTGMQVLIDSNNTLHGIEWDASKIQPYPSQPHHTAIHRHDFRVLHMDTEYNSLTLAKCLGTLWTVWFIRTIESHSLLSSTLHLQRSTRQWLTRRKLRSIAAYDVLMAALRGNADVVAMVIALL